MYYITQANLYNFAKLIEHQSVILDYSKTTMDLFK